MASKKSHQDSRHYAEDSFSEDEDEDEQEIEYEPQRVQGPSRSTRQRKLRATSSRASSGSIEPSAGEQELNAGLAGAAVSRRRGRGPSKQAPLNRNALLARENRLRKKAYMKDIEDKLKSYYEKNQSLTSIIERQDKQLQDLASQVNYYQSLVTNQYEINTLLVALNEAMKALHGSKDTVTSSLSTKVTAALKNINQNIDKYKWSASSKSQEEIASNQNYQSVSLPNMVTSDRSPNACQDELDGIVGGQLSTSFGQNIPSKIARKTMPLINPTSVGTSSLPTVPKTEEPSSVESLFMDDNHVNKFEQSPESHSYCEYNVTDTSSVGLGNKANNQVPTTPLSEAMSNSLDLVDASLSDTDLEVLSNVNVNNFVFDSTEAAISPSNSPSDDQCRLLDELFKSVNDKMPKHPTDEIDNLLCIDDNSRFNNRTLFNTLNPPTGICLHINSCRVSLEYCHLCYKRSLEKFKESLTNQP